MICPTSVSLVLIYHRAVLSVAIGGQKRVAQHFVSVHNWDLSFLKQCACIQTSLE